MSSVNCVSPWAGCLLGFGGLRWKPSTGRQVCIYLESGGWVPTRAASQTSADLVPGKPQCCLQGGHWGSEPGGPPRGAELDTGCAHHPEAGRRTTCH